MSEIVWKGELDTPVVLNDFKEKEIKLCIGLQASNDILSQLNRGINNNGVDFCLVIDKNIEKMDKVIDSITSLLIRLKENDTMSIITYTDSPQIITQGVKREDIHSVKDILERGLVSNYKQSNIHLALKQARNILENNQDGKIKKILLISNTDEDINELIVDEVLALETLNVTLDCLVMGEEANYDLLEKMSSKLGGVTNLINQYTDIEMPMRESLYRCHNSVLTNVTMKLIFNPTARVRHIYRGNPANSYLGRGERDTNNQLVINVGNIELRKCYNYYFDTAIRLKDDIARQLQQNSSDCKTPIAVGTIEFNIPSQNNIRKVIKINPQIAFTNNPNKVKRNEEIARGHCEVEITKLDRELERYIVSGDKIRAMNCAERIVQNCNKIGNTDLLRKYIELIKKYEETGLLDKRMLSGARDSSSKPVGGSVIAPPEIDIDKLEEIKALTR